jgi:hypothetical protein
MIILQCFLFVCNTLHFGRTSCWRPSGFNSHFRLKSKASGWSTPFGVSMALDVADAQLGLVSVLSPIQKYNLETPFYSRSLSTGKSTQ